MIQGDCRTIRAGSLLVICLNTGKTALRKDNQMARKPNYGYEKRQKELAKKAKKAEKNKRKQEEKDLENADKEETQETPEEE